MAEVTKHPRAHYVDEGADTLRIDYGAVEESTTIEVADNEAAALNVVDDGDTNDYWTIDTRNAQRAFVINEDGADIDFRVEGSGKPNALVVQGNNGKVGLGTLAVPHGGIGYALLALEGPDTHALGPHIQVTTDADDYPILQLFSWEHDEIEWMFDAYFDGAWRSSDVGSNARMRKFQDKFWFEYDSGVAQGVAIGLAAGIVMDLVTGNIGVGLSAALAKLHVDQFSASGAVPVLLLDQGDVSEQHIVCTMGGADVDFPAILELTVTGTPTLWWDESLDKFASTKGLILAGDLTLPKTSGNGITVDTTTPTFGWRDLLGDVFARNTGASKPTFTTYRDTLLDYQFAAGDEEYFKFHIPHDYVEGTDIHLHFHWSHIGALVTGGTVTFEYEVSYAKGHNQAAFPASVSGTVAGTASTTQYQQIISEGQLSASAPSGSQIDSDDLEPDGIIIMRAGLQANNITVSGGGVPDPFIHYVDIHYQSTNIGTKDKAPDFYA